MDKKLAVHVAAETIVLGSLTVYLINRIGALETRVAELEKDVQAIAKHSVAAEKKQVEVLNAMSHIIKSGAKPSAVSGGHNSGSHSGHNHVVHTVHKKPVQPVSAQKKKVNFSDADDEDPESSETEEEEESVPPPKMKAKAGLKGKGIKMPAPDSNVRARRDMSDVRAAAAKLAPQDDE